MHLFKKTFICLCALSLMFIAGSAGAAEMTPKVNHFILLYDGSGSMSNSHDVFGHPKAMVAKSQMQTMVENIPDLGYMAGLCTVAPQFAVNASPAKFPSPDYGRAISGLSVPYTEFGLQTPLADNLGYLEKILPKLPGKTALILFSDGGENKGGDPAQVTNYLTQKYDVCFHVVSYAQSPENKQTLNKMIQSQNCEGTMISARAFTDEGARTGFIQNIFYTRGGPADSDGDGVVDAKDQCPDTPAGVTVDATGCAVDSDGDGVADYKDECPDTRPNLVVDDKGCPVEARMDLNVEFETNKAEIKPKHTDELNRAGEFLQNHPNARMLIEGHTDSIGAADYNQQLSERRAASVKNYLVEEFNIDPDRLQAKGYGESRPVATNETAAGRQENRRVIGVVSKAFKQE